MITWEEGGKRKGERESEERGKVRREKVIEERKEKQTKLGKASNPVVPFHL